MLSEVPPTCMWFNIINIKRCIQGETWRESEREREWVSFEHWMGEFGAKKSIKRHINHSKPGSVIFGAWRSVLGMEF